MPQPNTHFLVIKDSMSESTPDLWAKYNNFAGFGSFGPDLFYLLGVPHVPGLKRKYSGNYSTVSDVLHWEASLDFFCEMMDYIKNAEDDAKRDKLKAFAYGYYSHVVADAVIHPFVYMATQDHWRDHPTTQFNRHKRLEAVIDGYLLGKRNSNPFVFEYESKVECHRQDSGRTLDEDVFIMMEMSLRKTYEGILDNFGIDFKKYFTQHEGSPNHPVLDAYRDYISSFRILYTLMRNVRIPQRLSVLVPISILNVEQLHLLEPEPRKQWHENDDIRAPSYNVQELFDLSVAAMREVIGSSEMFFASRYSDSRQFFRENAANVAYLDVNYNLDTGIPSSANKQLIGMATLAEAFRFSAPMLKEKYSVLESLVR